MFIVDKTRTQLINLDSVTTITKEEVPELDMIQYWADTMSNDTISLGKYEDTPEHENQILKIAEAAGALGTYYMPQEE